MEPYYTGAQKYTRVLNDKRSRLLIYSCISLYFANHTVWLCYLSGAMTSLMTLSDLSFYFELYQLLYDYFLYSTIHNRSLQSC